MRETRAFGGNIRIEVAGEVLSAGLQSDFREFLSVGRADGGRRCCQAQRSQFELSGDFSTAVPWTRLVGRPPEGAAGGGEGRVPLWGVVPARRLHRDQPGG